MPDEVQTSCLPSGLHREGVGVARGGLVFGHGLGLGKTIITLSAICELRFHRFQMCKVLIIAPKKVAEGTWQKECEKWDHLKRLRLSTVLGTEKQRAKALQAKADIYIINRENVPWLVDLYRNDWPFDMVVVDEFSSFKNHSSKRFKALASVRPHIHRFVGLTGTPTPNGLMDLWSQVYLLDGGARLEQRFTHFRDIYFTPGRRNGYVVFEYLPKEGAQEAITGRISDICISMKAEDYLTLPDMIEHEVPVVLDTKARKAYKELEKQMVLELVEEEEEIFAASAAALSNKLLQLANGAIYDNDGGTHNIHRCKIDAFMELLEALNGKPALVFYSFRHDLARLQEVLAKTTLRVRVLDGLKDQDDWNAGKIDVLLTHPGSSAYGLNLQAGGNHIIWFGLPWNYELYVQANKRLHRQGQTEKVIIHHLVVQHTRDEDVMKALGQKEDMQDAVLLSLKARIDQYRR